MFLDSLGVVSDAQALTATAVSTNTIDLGNVTPKRQIGDGEPIGFAVTVGVAADHTTGDETYEIDLVQSANADLSSPDTLSQQVIAAATLAAGAQVFVAIPPGYPTKRYLGLKYILGGTTPTVTLTAALMPRNMFANLPASYAKGYVGPD